MAILSIANAQGRGVTEHTDEHGLTGLTWYSVEKDSGNEPCHVAGPFISEDAAAAAFLAGDDDAGYITKHTAYFHRDQPEDRVREEQLRPTTVRAPVFGGGAIMSAATLNAGTHATAGTLLAALIVLREEHSRVEPHHEDMCPVCRQADAAIAEARRPS